jgi:hypothetical protein
MSHQPDERDLFSRLADDAHRAHLAGPEELRRTGDRRTAARAAAGSIAVVVAIGGVLVGANALGGSAAPEIEPGGTSTPTVVETIRSTPSPEGIPEPAWLSERDLAFPMDGRRELALPEPCGSPLVADVLESGRVPSYASRQGNFHAPGTPAAHTPDGTITQSILLMRDEQDAQELMERIRGYLAGCPEETTEEPGDIRYLLADPATPQSSDDHVLIDVSYRLGYLLGTDGPTSPDRVDQYVSVLRVGEVVTFLEIRGWEASDTDLADVHRLARLATARVLEWRFT